MDAHPIFAPVRRIAFIVIFVFCAMLWGMHFMARFHARLGLGAFLLVDEMTKRAYDAWCFVDAHKWLGVLYCITLLALTATVGRKKSGFSYLCWIAIPVLMAAGSWYFLHVALLSNKLVTFRLK
jgi:hypothetical protein